MPRPPRVIRTYHGTAAVRSYREALRWLARWVGCAALEVSDAPAPVGRYGGCCWLADGALELAEPNAPGTPTARLVERHGAGFLNLALHVDDLGAAETWFATRGATLSLPPSNHFSFTRPSETCGLQFEWADFTDQAWDPRQRGHRPPAVRGLVDAPRIAHWGALVADPAAAVARLAELWDGPRILERHDAPPEEPAAAIAIGDGVLTIYRLPREPQEEARLWGTARARPCFHLMAFRVRELAAAQAAFEREGIRILRGSAAAGEIVTHPADTQGLCMAWTDREIAGDPRGPLPAA